MSPTRASSSYDRWTTHTTREQRAEGVRHVVLHVERERTYTCVRPGCSATVTGAAMFCELHLWTFDHPLLEQAPIMGRVHVL